MVDAGNALVMSKEATIDGAAERIGVAPSVFRRWRKQFGDGTGPRPPKPERVGRSGLTRSEKKAQVARVLRKETTVAAIAAARNVSETAVHHWMKIYRSEVAAELKKGSQQLAAVNLPMALSRQPSGAQRVTVIQAAHVRRMNGGGAAEVDLAVRETFMLLQNASRDLDGVRPADLDEYQLKTLMARGRLKTVFGK